MGKYEKTFIGDNCPICGDALIVTTSCSDEDDTEFDIYFMDGDDVICAAECGFVSCVSADGENAWIQDGNLDDLP